MKTKIIIACATVIAFIGAGIFLLNNFLYTVPDTGEKPERGTITGTYMCLPLRDSTQRDTDCAAGILSDEGAYYAIDFGFYSQGLPQLVEGDTLKATGVVTPIETLSTDYWKKYPVIGIFSVTDSLEVEEKEEPVFSPTSSSSVTFTPWVWQQTSLADGSVLQSKEGKFVLSFKDDLSYHSTTDCNTLSGTYAVDGEVLSLSTPAMTKMFCEGSIEQDYVAQLVLASSHVIEGDTLRILLNRDFGVMEFKAQ